MGQWLAVNDDVIELPVRGVDLSKYGTLCGWWGRERGGERRGQQLTPRLADIGWSEKASDGSISFGGRGSF